MDSPLNNLDIFNQAKMRLLEDIKTLSFGNHSKAEALVKEFQKLAPAHIEVGGILGAFSQMRESKREQVRWEGYSRGVSLLLCDTEALCYTR